MAAQHAEPKRVFLNIPYDAKFERLYLAYIVGVIELGLQPRATLAIPGAERVRTVSSISFSRVLIPCTICRGCSWTEIRRLPRDATCRSNWDWP
jgi:hypothetical protein